MKNHTNYKPKHEYYSVVLYEKKGDVGELLDFVFEDGRCGMNHYFWGSETDYEYNQYGEVEHNYIWDKENTEKLMLRTGSKNGKDLVNNIYERFHANGSYADQLIKEWCKQKKILYVFQAWY